jgi:hypothetical protein
MELKHTLETEFSLRMFDVQVQQMSEDQAKELLVRLYEQTLLMEKYYQSFLKEQLGLSNEQITRKP